MTTGVSLGLPADRSEPFSVGEQWMSDAQRILGIRGGMVQCLVDMTQAKASVGALRARGVAATFTHVIVRATALTLARRPELFHTVCGYDKVTSASVDIGLSTDDPGGGIAPGLPLVLAGVDRTPLAALGGAIQEAAARARAEEARLRGLGWLTRFGFIRRWLLRRWSRKLSARRRLAGTFGVYCDSNADLIVPLQFYTDAVLSAGRVHDLVIDVDGHPAIRPMAWLTLCVDHVALDGVRGAALINAVKETLEGDELLGDALG